MRGKRAFKQNLFDLGAMLLQRRCIFGEGLTQEDLAAWRGCTRQRIEQIEAKALRKLRIRLKIACQDDRKLYTELMDEMFNRRTAAVPRPKSKC